MRVLMIIPAYNEQGNILNVISDIQSCTRDVDYIIINDCSTDATEKILKEANANYINLPVNLGIGGGVQTGYRYAKEQGYDIAVQFDGDGQHSAEYIGSLLAPILSGEADVVIGSRFIEKTGFQSSALRRMGVKFLSVLIRFLCGIKVKDVTSGMRAVDRRMIEFFAQHYPQDYPEPEAILMSQMVGARIAEVPVQMKARSSGKSSINAIRSLYYMVKVSLALIIARFSYRRGEV